MESQIYVFSTPSEMKAAFYSNTFNIRQFQNVSTDNADDDDICVYRVILRHPEYVTELRNKKPYASWESLSRAMARKHLAN